MKRRRYAPLPGKPSTAVGKGFGSSARHWDCCGALGDRLRATLAAASRPVYLASATANSYPTLMRGTVPRHRGPTSHDIALTKPEQPGIIPSILALTAVCSAAGGERRCLLPLFAHHSTAHLAAFQSCKRTDQILARFMWMRVKSPTSTNSDVRSTLVFSCFAYSCNAQSVRPLASTQDENRNATYHQILAAN